MPLEQFWLEGAGKTVVKPFAETSFFQTSP